LVFYSSTIRSIIIFESKCINISLSDKIKIIQLTGNVVGIVAMKKAYYFICKTEGLRVIDTSMDDVLVLKHILRK